MFSALLCEVDKFLVLFLRSLDALGHCACFFLQDFICSEKIDREEDDRELALIEAEERDERERALKRQKLQRK